MNSLGNWIRKGLFRLLPFETYLRLISSAYFTAFRMGLLKGKPAFAHPYFLPKILRPGDVCIDIGANLGYYTVVLAEAVGPEGKVFAVEPVEPVRKVLQFHTRKFSNVEIIPYALGDANKPIQLGNPTLYFKGYVSTGSHFVLDSKIDRPSGDEVRFHAQMRRGSELFGALPRLDFIKCDIEGYETIVLPEMEPVIMRHRPILQVELHGKGRKAMFQFFRERGFEAWELTDWTLHPAPEDGFWDVLFVPECRRDRIQPYIEQGQATV